MREPKRFVLVADNRRTVFDFEAEQISGFPDGLTIDRDGNLWVALYDGSQVRKLLDTLSILVIGIV